MVEFNNLVEKLAKKDILKDDFLYTLNNIEELEDYDISSLDDLNSLGLDVAEENGCVHLNTVSRSYKEQEFCVVDIETNGCTLIDAKVIEIGAVTLKNGEIINEFNSLIYTDFLPEVITNLTGINTQMLQNAPSEASVLEKFRLFLGDSVFVAHNVEFDFNYLSYAYLRHNMPPLLNRRLCTINLARKTFEAQKYGLQALREKFEITEGEAHRAYWDAKSAAMIFNISCKNLSDEIKTTEDLLLFAKANKKSKKKKQQKLPLFEEENED